MGSMVISSLAPSSAGYDSISIWAIYVSWLDAYRPTVALRADMRYIYRHAGRPARPPRGAGAACA